MTGPVDRRPPEPPDEASRGTPGPSDGASPNASFQEALQQEAPSTVRPGMARFGVPNLDISAGGTGEGVKRLQQMLLPAAVDSPRFVGWLARAAGETVQSLGSRVPPHLQQPVQDEMCRSIRKEAKWARTELGAAAIANKRLTVFTEQPATLQRAIRAGDKERFRAATAAIHAFAAEYCAAPDRGRVASVITTWITENIAPFGRVSPQKVQHYLACLSNTPDSLAALDAAVAGRPVGGTAGLRRAGMIVLLSDPANSSGLEASAPPAPAVPPPGRLRTAIRAVAQAGDLELWARQVITTGPRTALAYTLRNAVPGPFQNAFSGLQWAGEKTFDLVNWGFNHAVHKPLLALGQAAPYTLRAASAQVAGVGTSFNGAVMAGLESDPGRAARFAVRLSATAAFASQLVHAQPILFRPASEYPDIRAITYQRPIAMLVGVKFDEANGATLPGFMGVAFDSLLNGPVGPAQVLNGTVGIDEALRRNVQIIPTPPGLRFTPTGLALEAPVALRHGVGLSTFAVVGLPHVPLEAVNLRGGASLYLGQESITIPTIGAGTRPAGAPALTSGVASSWIGPTGVNLSGLTWGPATVAARFAYGANFERLNTLAGATSGGVGRLDAFTITQNPAMVDTPINEASRLKVQAFIDAQPEWVRTPSNGITNVFDTMVHGSGAINPFVHFKESIQPQQPVERQTRPQTGQH